MKAIVDWVMRLRVGEPKAHLNLAIFPIFDGDGGPPDYLTLEEALARKTANITEVSAGGSVPEISFVNGSDRRVFLLDGEELIGAKQNRVLNLSIMVPPGVTIVIPVSCVERGRWSYRSKDFGTSPYAQYAEGRAKRLGQVTSSMMTGAGRRSDQAEVWRDIELKSQKLRHRSATGAMSDIYDSVAAGLGEFLRVAEAVPGQVGVLFAIDGLPVGFDIFDSTETLRKLLSKIVRSYALDALSQPWRRGAAAGESPAPSKADAESFLRLAAEAKASVFSGTGEGEDVRLTGKTLSGAALVVNGRVIHLAGFRAVDTDQGKVV